MEHHAHPISYFKGHVWCFGVSGISPYQVWVLGRVAHKGCKGDIPCQLPLTSWKFNSKRRNGYEVWQRQLFCWAQQVFGDKDPHSKICCLSNKRAKKVKNTHCLPHPSTVQLGLHTWHLVFWRAYGKSMQTCNTSDIIAGMQQQNTEELSRCGLALLPSYCWQLQS